LAKSIDILQPLVAEMLATVKNIFRGFGVDYFLVGAVARDIQLSANPDLAAKRKTNDIDIALLLDNEKQFYEIKEAMLATGKFEESSYKAIKLMYRDSIEVDLLPFGDIEDEHRQLQLSRHTLLVMDMSGFKEVYPFVETHTVADGLSLNVCPLEGLVLLKLIANNDNPSRTKDITDIEHFIKVYFELNADQVYTDHLDVMDLYDTAVGNYLPLVSARVIGRKMKTLLQITEGAKENISGILSKRPMDTWQAMLDGIND
jgi:predicted nucleotidyltransferase